MVRLPGSETKINTMLHQTQRSDTGGLTLTKFFNDTYIGIERGWSVDTLPYSVRSFLNEPFIRIFRVIGGICLLLVLSDAVRSGYFIFPLKVVIYIFAILQILQIFVILLIKSIYGLKTIIRNKKVFDIRNSPHQTRSDSAIGPTRRCVGPLSDCGQTVSCAVGGASNTVRLRRVFTGLNSVRLRHRLTTSFLFFCMQISIAIAFYVITYLLIFKFQAGNLFGLFISFIVSFVVSTFVLDKFNYSEFRIIRFIQKFIFYNLFVIFISIMFIFFF